MKIITGYRGEPHITSQQDRNVNIGIFGSGTHIVNVGSKMAATIVSANEIVIADGLLVAEGCTAEIARGTSESIAVDNGSQGMLRKDLIVARYTRESGTGIEDMQLVYIAGTPAASSPALPSYNTGSIANGDTIVDFPIYTINLDGISIESVTRMVDYAELASKSAVDALETTMGTGTLATAAKNVIGAINELRTTITGIGTRMGTAERNITTLEGKGDGINGSRTLAVSAGGTSYVQLGTSSSYIVLVNANAIDNSLRGAYLVGVNGEKHIGIKAINTASNVEIIDAGSVAGNYTGVMRIRNNGGTSLRVTIITTFGTAA